MSSQVPATTREYISDIAFETSHPYSLHPTATDEYINVGDRYWYASGLRLTYIGGAYSYQTSCGPLSFGVDMSFEISDIRIGSSTPIHKYIIYYFYKCFKILYKYTYTDHIILNVIFNNYNLFFTIKSFKYHTACCRYLRRH